MSFPAAHRVFTPDTLQPARYPQDLRHVNCRLPGGVTYERGQVLAEVPAPQRGAVFTLTVAATGGTYRVGLASGREVVFTDPIPAAATAAQQQPILDRAFGPGTFTVSGAGPFTYTAGGDLANAAVAAPTADAAAATGGGVTVATATTGSSGAAGSYAAIADPAATGGVAVLLERSATDATGRRLTEFGFPGGQTHVAVSAGDFYTRDLIGLTADNLTRVGKLVAGAEVTGPGAIVRVGV